MDNQRVTLVVLMLLVAGCSSLGTRAPKGVDLTGIWDLNPKYSDSPRALQSGLQHEERSRHRRFGDSGDEGRMNRGPGGIGQGPDGGFPLGRPAGGGEFAARRMGRGFVSELNAGEMDIEQRRDSMRIEYDRKDTRIYHWGESQSRRDPGEPASGWSKGNYVIRAEGRSGRGIVRTFTLSADHKTLTVVTTLGKHSITQRYDLNQAATARVYGGGQD